MLDTIIIGAGWAGVVAARDLATRGYRVLVLEARDRVGGRAHTHTEGMHAPVDLGCSWIHGYNEGNPVREIAAAEGVSVDVAKPSESAVYGPEGRLQPAVAAQLRTNLGAAHAAAKAFAQTNTPAPPDSAALATFLLAPASPLFTNTDTGLATDFARTLEAPFGAPLERVSLRWAGWDGAFAGADGAPAGGFVPLVMRVLDAARTAGATLRLGERVDALEHRADDGRGTVAVRTSAGTYHARTAVCTVPLGVLQHAPLLFTPPLPARRAEAIARTHVGTLEKLVLAYPAAWWPAGTLTFLPAAPTDAADEVLAALAAHTLVAAPAPSAPATLLFYLSPAPAARLARFSLADLTRGAHAFLVVRLRPAVPPPPPSASVRTDWAHDEYARGATTTPVLAGEGRSPLDFVELGKPLWGGRLGFAGEHTDADHRGSVAGAVLSGQREAARVHRLLAMEKE